MRSFRSVLALAALICAAVGAPAFGQEKVRVSVPQRGIRENSAAAEAVTCGLSLGAHNPLIRRHFLGVFRFARMALADARNLTHATIKG
jgi:hypothetical protein